MIIKSVVTEHRPTPSKGTQLWEIDEDGLFTMANGCGSWILVKYGEVEEEWLYVYTDGRTPPFNVAGSSIHNFMKDRFIPVNKEVTLKFTPGRED